MIDTTNVAGVIALASFLKLRELGETCHITPELFIACVNRDRLLSLFRHCDWINVGLSLSKALLDESPDDYKLAVPSLLRKWVSEVPGNHVVLDRIDFLFLPMFQLDVINLFRQLNRNKGLIVVWPGVLDGRKLIYSKPGYPDYRIYDLTQYNDVICITDKN